LSSVLHGNQKHARGKEVAAAAKNKSFRVVPPSNMYAKIVRVCIRHNTEDITTNNNAAPQARNAIASFAPPHQSDSFEDEEELNSCIWRSC
jgi:hypothetical protein